MGSAAKPRRLPCPAIWSSGNRNQVSASLAKQKCFDDMKELAIFANAFNGAMMKWKPIMNIIKQNKQ